MKTHEPKKGSKLDFASSTTKQTIETELAQVEEGLCHNGIWDEIFKKVIGDDKYGYAKTYGMGVKVPCSNSKRCALQEECAERVKIEEQYKESQVKV